MSRRVTLASYAALTLLALLPVFAAPIPCIGDYLNHLARIHILLALDQSAALRGYYDPHWHLMPYLGMDLPVAALAEAIGIYRAGRVFVAVCVLMPVIATIALHRALYGRVGLVPVIAFLIGYNFVLALGFLPYLFSSCLAVLLFAGWIAAAKSPIWGRGIAFMLPAALLYLSHSFAFIAYGLLVLGWELGAARAAWPNLRKIATAWAAASLQIIPPVALAVWLRVDATFGIEQVTRYGSIADRIAAFLSPIYFPGAPLLMPVMLLAIPAGLFLLRPRLAKPVLPALLLVTLAACAAPHMLLNIWGVEFRLPLVAAIVLIAALAPPATAGRHTKVAVLAGITLLLLARAITTATLWSALDAQIAQVRAVTASLPPGQRLLVVDAPQDAPLRLATRATIQQISMVAAIDRDAFIPSLFVGTSPLRLRPAMQDSASQGVNPLDFAQLDYGYTHAAPPGPVPAWRDGGQMYWLGWPEKFDYVLVLNYGGAIAQLPNVLYKVAGNDIASLYHIKR